MNDLSERTLSKCHLRKKTNFNFQTGVGFAQAVRITIFREEIDVIDAISSKQKTTLQVSRSTCISKTLENLTQNTPRPVIIRSRVKVRDLWKTSRGRVTGLVRYAKTW
jgi:hypothetical protein